ncbi:DUF6090 family protein [Winogradskyella sp.]|uniref:DUF6090 family protein n=1 Tax=Winogradskyella sp. TaxID=1883156 RepID=UPI0025E07386|nr:DUF6090 family protein [Winogradskyella sp.]
MEKNKTGKYFKYAIGEIVLVVIGILIALSINNWNENNKLDTKKQSYYQQLLEDLKKDKEFSENTIAKFRTQRKTYEDYRQEFYKTKLSPQDVNKNLFDLHMEAYGIFFNSSTIETLQNSGEIALIPAVLRNKLIDLKRFQERISQGSQNSNRSKNNVTESIFILLGQLDLEERIEKQGELKTFLNIEENRKEIILGMESIQGWKNHSETTTIRELEELLKDITIIEELIQKEIKD